MGKYKYLIIHCADTPPEMKVTGDMIKQWHMSPTPHGRGWDRPGYSEFIRRDGTIDTLVEVNDDNIIEYNEMTWGALGVNDISKHICLAGGQKSSLLKEGIFKFIDIYTPCQFDALQRIIKGEIYHNPQIEVGGHNQFNKKTCPNFDTVEFCYLIDIPEENICKLPILE